MALYHLSVKIISRSDGSSAVGAAAYRSGQKLTDEYDGRTHDYSRKRYVEQAVILLPENAPAEFADRERLWNSVEQIEKQANAQLAREIEFSLPCELSPEEQRRIALEFVQEQFVDRGMIADICFHKQHMKKMSSEGKNPNPHCHVLVPLRPLNENGEWAAKQSTLYVCEKSGEQRLMSPSELKIDPEWEKLYCYKDSTGEKVWLTKSQAEAQDGYALTSKYPRRETVPNPKVAEWNSTDMLKIWREAWAKKVNETFESFGMDERIDHRSYKDQGLELIPTIHEGKDITALEQKLFAEYQQKLSRGEDAVLQHTEIREKNIAIQEHNREVTIIAEIRKLREKLQKIMAPVRERIRAAGQSIAHKLEQLRIDICKLGVRIRVATEMKASADEKIRQNQAYLKDLGPVREDRLGALRQEKTVIQGQLSATGGIFGKKKKEELRARLSHLDSMISLHEENGRYAAKANTEIEHLSDVSNEAKMQIKQLKFTREIKEIEYTSLEKSVSEPRDEILKERLSIRRDMESKQVAPAEEMAYMKETQKFDRAHKSARIESPLKMSTETTKIWLE